jgi:hypothetical protein
MNNELQVRKLHIDTRFKTKNSKSNSNFSINISEPIRLPKDTICYVTNICLPVSWSMIQPNRNNRFYYKLNSSSLLTLIIPEGNYSVDLLAKLLKDCINVFSAGSVDASYDLDLNNLTITPLGGNTLQIPTDEDLINSGLIEPLNSINNILQNYTNSKIYSNSNKYVSNYIDLFPVRNLYLQCENICTGSNSMLCSGQSNIIANIPITARYNQLVICDKLISMDYVNVGNQTINFLKFRLINLWGEEIDLRGNHFSFSLLFNKL